MVYLACEQDHKWGIRGEKIRESGERSAVWGRENWASLECVSDFFAKGAIYVSIALNLLFSSFVHLI